MIHPGTELRYIDADIGFGVFATAFIPRGTLVYVQDELDISITEDEFDAMDEHMQRNVEHYSFIDQHGHRVLCWDHAKYVNHCCHPNIISTGYGFEIAITDIAEGEQVTDDYGLFNVSYDTEFGCGIEDCRRRIFRDDPLRYHSAWDKQVVAALRCFGDVPQALLPYLDADIRDQLYAYLAGEAEYLSVLNTLYRGDAQVRATG